MKLENFFVQADEFITASLVRIGRYFSRSHHKRVTRKSKKQHSKVSYENPAQVAAVKHAKGSLHNENRVYNHPRR